MIDKGKYTALWLAVKQSELFMADNISYTNCLVKGGVCRIIMLWAYNWLVNTKRIIPIENIPEDEKETLWLTAKDIAANRLDKDKIIEFSKALYCLEYVLNLTEWNGMPIN